MNIPGGGIIHAFKNNTKVNAHLWCVVVPAGLELFFEEIGKPVPFGTLVPSVEMNEELKKRLEKIAGKHGQKIYPPDYLD